MASKSLTKNSVFNIIYNIVNLFFPLITSIYVSRVLMPDGIGQVAYAQSIASYFVTIATLGIPTYGVRELSKVKDCKEEKNKLFSQLFFINFISTIICSFIYIILVFSIARFKNDSVLFLCCGLLIILNFLNIDWLYQVEEEYVYIAGRNIFIKIISLVFVFVFVKNRDDYILYAFILSFAAVGNYIFNIIHARKFVKISFRFELLDRTILKKHMEPIFFLSIASLLGTIYSKIDITMLGSLSTDRATGIYANAHRLTEVVISICTAISAVFLPRLSYSYKKNQDQFYHILDLGFKILCFISIPTAVGLFLLASNAVEIMFGNSFSAATTTLRLFSILIIIKSFGNLFCFQLAIATGNEKKRLPTYIAAVVINVILNLILIPIYAQDGATIASVVSEIIVNGIQFVVLFRIIHFPISFKALFQSLISTGIMAVSVILVMKIDLAVFPQTALAVSVGVFIYIIFNIAFRNDLIIYFLKKIMKIRR